MSNTATDTHTTSALLCEHDGVLTEAGLARAIACGIRAPLAALRASLESFERAFDPEDPRAETLVCVRNELVRVTHNVQALTEYACPTPALPLDCSVEEILDTTLACLPAELRERVLIAVEHGAERMRVDGPRLAHALTRRIEWALARSSEPALLSARRSGCATSFHIVHSTVHDAQGRETVHPTLAAAGDLFDLLSTRELGVVGARSTTRRTATGLTEIEVRFADGFHALDSFDMPGAMPGAIEATDAEASS